MDLDRVVARRRPSPPAFRRHFTRHAGRWRLRWRHLSHRSGGGSLCRRSPVRRAGRSSIRRCRPARRAGRSSIRRRRLGLRRLAREPEIEDVPLHRGEPAGAVRRYEVLLPLHALALDEGVERIAPRPSPGREQLVALGEVARDGAGVPGPAVDLAPRTDVAPVLPAGGEHEQVDLDPLRGPAQHFEIGGRQEGHPEEGRTTGPAGRPAAGREPRVEGVDGRDPVIGRRCPPLSGNPSLRGASPLFIQPLCPGGPALFDRPLLSVRPSLSGQPLLPSQPFLSGRPALSIRLSLSGRPPLSVRPFLISQPPFSGPPPVSGQAPPQPRLPVRGRAALPFPDPVRAVEQAAVEDPGEAVRELEALARIPVPEVAPYRALPRPLSQLRQDVMDAPPQPRRGMGLLFGKVRRRLAHDRPGELGGQLEADVGRDAERARKLQREPPSDGGMRDDDPLGSERLVRVRAHEACKLARQRLHPVRMMQPHAAEGGRRGPEISRAPRGSRARPRRGCRAPRLRPLRGPCASMHRCPCRPPRSPPRAPSSSPEATRPPR